MVQKHASSPLKKITKGAKRKDKRFKRSELAIIPHRGKISGQFSPFPFFNPSPSLANSSTQQQDLFPYSLPLKTLLIIP
jgi:hypothetical protein